MILFYSKKDGKIFATIDGRVHNQEHLKSYVNPGLDKKDIGRYIIGWIENKEGKVDYNLDKFDLLQKFEDITPDSPLDYKVVDGELKLNK